MRIKVELHREVIRLLRHECSEEEVSAFNQGLRRLRSDAVALIENSEAIHDPQVSRYMLRSFRFADCIAIFETNRERDLIRVRQCRRLQPRRQERQEPGDGL